MVMTMHVDRLREEQIAAATTVLARCYSEQPYPISFEPDCERRLRSFCRGLLPEVTHCYCHGEPYAATADGQLLGVALWMPPHAKRAPEEEQEFGLDRLEEIFGPAFTGFIPVDQALHRLRKRDMKGPHWFIRLLGIAPEQSLDKVGPALLEPIIARSDENQVPCYIENGLPELVPLYLKLGFEMLVEEVEPKTGQRYWTFRRCPQPIPSA
jgi:hypothetical protein